MIGKMRKGINLPPANPNEASSKIGLGNAQIAQAWQHR